MKKLYIPIALIALCAFSFAQVPDMFNYQAVAYDNNGDPLSEDLISVRVSILHGSANGISDYEESHLVTTNNFGLFSLKIGGGQLLSGSFEMINWSAGSKFLQIEIDADGGSNYQPVGTVQLLSVPYALYAAASPDDADADPENELQDISLIGSELSITGGSSIELSALDTDDQDLSLDGTNLSITDGNTVDLATLLTEDLDNDPSNEIQDISLTGSELSITGGSTVELSAIDTDDQDLSLSGTSLSISDGNSVDLVGLIPENLDNDPTNEIQDLLLNSNILTITNNATPTDIDLAPYLDNTNLNEATVESYITNGAINLANGTTLNGNSLNDWNSLANIPADIANGDQDEQSLSLSGTTLTLTNGGSVSLSSFFSPWTTSGTNIYRTSGNIGIGTTSPVTALQVYANRDVLFGSSMAGNGARLIWDYSSRAFRAGYSAASSWNEDSIGLYSSAFGFGSVALGYMSFATGFYTRAKTYSGFSIGRYNVGASGTAASWATSDPLFEVGNGTSNTNRNNAFTIRKDGRVAINDATPDYLLDIENTDKSMRSIYINHDNTSSSSNMYSLYINADNTASNSGVSYGAYVNITNNNDNVYGIYSLAYGDATDDSPAYGIYTFVDNDNGSGGAYGIYASVSGTTSGVKYAGYFNGNVYTTGSYLPSDRKLKTNLRPVSKKATTQLMQLQVTSFEYLNGKNNIRLPEGRQTGLIAQDVEKQFPELVHEVVQPAPSPEELEEGAEVVDAVTFKAVDYTRLIPYLVKAIQEQQEEIESLKERLEVLEQDPLNNR